MNSKVRYQSFAIIVGMLLCTQSVVGQGIVLPAGGAVNRGMGGATTGAAIDAIGSMYWNPATISRFEKDEFGFGFELVNPKQNIASTFPAVGSGSTDTETGSVPVPTIAWVHQTSNPDVKFGLGVLGTGGFSLNMPADPTNPVLSPPQALGGVGVGGIRAEAQYFQLAPAFSVRLTESLSMGIGPTLGLGRLTFDENSFVGPNANGMYPRGDGTRFHWGIGGQIGLHYVHNCCWEFGVNLKSPVWFESLEYHSEDAAGLPRNDFMDFDLPMILSGGVAYKGFEYAVLALDLRHINYSATDGFGDSASYQPTGAVNGLGWNDQFALALGGQFLLTEKITGRLGYVYSSELFDEADTFFNFGADLGYRHTINSGASYQLTEKVLLSAAYSYILPYGAEGPYILPGTGVVPGSSVSTDFSVHFVTIGLNVRY